MSNLRLRELLPFDHAFFAHQLTGKEAAGHVDLARSKRNPLSLGIGTRFGHLPSPYRA